tara:strand:+ start:573 stop:836 length:264 start_codon:yes stop_codon:yes gene_type:complete
MNPLIDRIWSTWTNSAQEELLAMIAEFRVDYLLDDTFNHALDIVEEAILEENYDRAKIIFTEMSPAVFTRLDFELFVELLDEAVYGY